MRCRGARCERRYEVNRMRACAPVSAIETDHAARSSLGYGEVVFSRDSIQGLRKRSGLRRIAKRDVDIVGSKRARGTAFRRLQLRPNSNLRFVAVDFLRSAD